MSLNFGQFGQLISKLLALERQKFNSSPIFLGCNDLILFKLVCYEDMYNIFDVFEFRPDLITDYLPLNVYNRPTPMISL